MTTNTIPTQVEGLPTLPKPAILRDSPDYGVEPKPFFDTDQMLSFRAEGIRIALAARSSQETLTEQQCEEIMRRYFPRTGITNAYRSIIRDGFAAGVASGPASEVPPFRDLIIGHMEYRITFLPNDEATVVLKNATPAAPAQQQPSSERDRIDAERWRHHRLTQMSPEDADWEADAAIDAARHAGDAGDQR